FIYKHSVAVRNGKIQFIQSFIHESILAFHKVNVISFSYSASDGCAGRVNHKKQAGITLARESQCITRLKKLQNKAIYQVAIYNGRVAADAIYAKCILGTTHQACDGDFSFSALHTHPCQWLACNHLCILKAIAISACDLFE